MSASTDLIAQSNIQAAQGSQNPKPNTIASTTTIVPSHGLTVVTGTIDVATITPPLEGYHQLVLAFSDDSPGDILTTGNVLIGTTTVSKNVPILLFYNPNLAKYYVK